MCFIRRIILNILFVFLTFVSFSQIKNVHVFLEFEITLPFNWISITQFTIHLFFFVSLSIYLFNNIKNACIIHSLRSRNIELEQITFAFWVHVKFDGFCLKLHTSYMRLLWNVEIRVFIKVRKIKWGKHANVTDGDNLYLERFEESTKF